MFIRVTASNLITAKVEFVNDLSNFYDQPFECHSKMLQYYFKEDNSNLNVTPSVVLFINS